MDELCEAHRDALKMVRSEQKHSSGALLPLSSVVRLMKRAAVAAAATTKVNADCAKIKSRKYVSESIARVEPMAVAAFYAALEFHLVSVFEEAIVVQDFAARGFVSWEAVKKVFRLRDEEYEDDVEDDEEYEDDVPQPAIGGGGNGEDAGEGSGNAGGGGGGDVVIIDGNENERAADADDA